jgi:Na+-transporting methylmalonyl-CoA/oxaloacetate decarboxylase gamma subunit
MLGGVGFVLLVGSLLAIAVTGCGNNTSHTESVEAGEARGRSNPSSGDSLERSGKGMAAIKQAADAGKYLFMFFSKTDDDQTLAMRKVFDKAMEKVADRAQWVAVSTTDSSERAIVAKFELSRAPMPLVLAMAPNGAITGGFPTKFEEQQLLDAFATPATEKVMKQLQDSKLVFLCVQNGKTKSNDAAMQGVRDFKADARFASATEIVMLDPADSAETSFLADLKIDPKTEEAVTVFLAPPGSAIAEYKGATDKAELAATLQKASSGSCAGGSCGPGGCPPNATQKAND